jgi:uncharacterized membrane protein YqiK
VQENEGRASLARATQNADQTRTLAQAEADRIRMLGEGEARKVVALAGAEAERVSKVGLAQAQAIDAQVTASGGARYQLARQIAERFAEALEKSGVDVVPKVNISGAEGQAGGSLLQALMTTLLSEKLDISLADASGGRGNGAVQP